MIRLLTAYFLLFSIIIVDGNERLDQLRKLFSSEKILNDTMGYALDVYILANTDAHLNEYISIRDARIAFLSNFTGSNAVVAVTRKQAFLWTDSRYLIQAKKQLPEGWELHEALGNPLYLGNITNGSIVGFDPELFPYESAKAFVERLRKQGIKAVPILGNLVDDIWKSRPSNEDIRTHRQIIVLEDSLVGENVTSKIGRVRQRIEQLECKSAIFAGLDDIMWLLNIRGKDIPYNPQCYSYLYMNNESVHLFIDIDKLIPDVREHLTKNGVTCHEYDTFHSFLSNREMSNKSDLPIHVPRSTNYRIVSSLSNYKIKESVILEMKAKKNPVEIEGSRNGHLRDSVALVEFLYWMEQEIVRKKKVYTELDISTIVKYFRSNREYFMSLSFESVVAADEHSALPHYNPENGEGNKTITRQSVLLLDSGAHYKDATTDVTRTVLLDSSNKSSNFSFHYTLVTKGHISLASTIFINGITGAQLDTIARRPLWKYGLDYGHGTGHGFGFFLNVHEYPGSIQPKTFYPFTTNHFVTIEPGFYWEDHYGIRFENCYVIVPTGKIHSGRENFLKFEPLTLVPIQTDILDTSIMTQEEIDWLNWYHKIVQMKVGTILTEEGKNEVRIWLDKKCAPISKV